MHAKDVVQAITNKDGHWRRKTVEALAVKAKEYREVAKNILPEGGHLAMHLHAVAAAYEACLKAQEALHAHASLCVEKTQN